MTQRPLFHTNDSGELIRNYYCLECNAGPFTQEDIDKNNLIEKGSGKQMMHYCKKCCLIKFRYIPETLVEETEIIPKIIKESNVEETVTLPKIVEEISFENMSGSEIISLVKIKTECFIPISPKSKKSVLKHARRILEEKGFKVK